MESIYDQWAGIYDAVYSYLREDVPFYVEEARRAGGPVLELGCGTGRVSIPIAEAGIDIVGLDSSIAMLDVARGKLQRLQGRGGSLALVNADMRDFVPENDADSHLLDRKFNLALIPFRGFLSLLTVEDQMRTLRTVTEHLAPGGKLIFNIFVPDLNMLLQEGDVPYHFRDVTDPDTGERLVVWHQSSYDNQNQIINVRTIIEELGVTGEVSRRLYRDFQLRYVHRWEMHHLLRACGYEVLYLFGDFDRSPFDETSGEMVWVVAPAT